MTRVICSDTIDFIKKGEALRLTAYKDSVGVWTIGWGHTGPEVVKGLTITRAKALAYLKADLQIAANRLAGVVKAEVIELMTDHQYGALISFVFNCGADPKWGFWKVVNSKKWDAVPAYLMRFTKGRVNGVMQDIPGLHNRRAAEVAFWKSAHVAEAVAIIKAGPVAPPSSETRVMETPPAPQAVKPVLLSKSFMTSAASAVSVGAVTFTEVAPGVADGIQKTASKLDPIADHVEMVGRLRNALLVIVALITVSVPFFIWLKNHKAKTA